MPETLLTCPHCRIPNFTERGLRNHRCKAATALDPEVLLAGDSASADSALAATTLAAVETGWQEAKRLADLAKNFTRASTAAKALCGIRLRALREHYFGPRKAQGGRPAKKPEIASGFSSWEELVADRVGVTDRTARTWMDMADAVEEMAARESLNLQDIITKLPWDWTLAEAFVVEDAVAKITEGRSQKELLALQSDFLSDLGCERKERGGANNPAGRNGAGKKQPPANPQELLKQRQEAARKMFTGTTEPGKAAHGSPALFLDRFVETAGAELEALSQAELRHLYEHTVAPFATAFRRLAGL